MKKGNSGIHIHFTNRWLYTFIVIGILAVAGVVVYAATYSPSGAGHPYTEISTCSANQVLQMNSNGTAWTCANLPSSSQWPYLQDVKITSASHNGDFDGYQKMYNWIQSNGCSGYHVCSANEIVNALQRGMNPLANNTGAWSNTGVAPTYPKGTSSSVIVNDCQGWEYTGDSAMGLTFYKRNYNYGGVLYTGTQPTDVYCSSLYPVLCCK